MGARMGVGAWVGRKGRGRESGHLDDHHHRPPCNSRAGAFGEQELCTVPVRSDFDDRCRLNLCIVSNPPEATGTHDTVYVKACSPADCNGDFQPYVRRSIEHTRPEKLCNCKPTRGTSYHKCISYLYSLLGLVSGALHYLNL